MAGLTPGQAFAFIEPLERRRTAGRVRGRRDGELPRRRALPDRPDAADEAARGRAIRKPIRASSRIFGVYPHPEPALRAPLPGARVRGARLTMAHSALVDVADAVFTVLNVPSLTAPPIRSAPAVPARRPISPSSTGPQSFPFVWVRTRRGTDGRARSAPGRGCSRWTFASTCSARRPACTKRQQIIAGSDPVDAPGVNPAS